ncbi:hypothetical protein O6H91_02G082500 [Diphasiastrum complanatum]|uniref:Uncharacterized protein n=1 Tax=Diphasiastrum complanatum TaxID=34168 RepID=A0ACC2EHG4_DIPCM|nr:hypothetical protein O6H91_02G082500 [Diphasiastrum complanatum]
MAIVSCAYAQYTNIAAANLASFIDVRFPYKILRRVGLRKRRPLSAGPLHHLGIQATKNQQEVGHATLKDKKEGKMAGSGSINAGKVQPQQLPQNPYQGSKEGHWSHDEEYKGYAENNHHEQQLIKTRKEITVFGVDLSPDIIAISTVYFVQGILGLSRLAVSFFLKDDLHLSPAETAILSGVSALPWLVKPLYGFISDGLPLFGYKRRSYLILCGFLGALSWSTLATFVDNKYEAVAAIFMSSLSVAFSDVVVDSMVVERARGETQGTSGTLQSLCWGSSAVGGIVSAYFSGYLVQTHGVRFVFGITALLPLITSAVSFLVQEKPISAYMSGDGSMPKRHTTLIRAKGIYESAKVQSIFLWKTIKEPKIFLPTLFIFLWQATPTSETAMFYYTTNKLGFGPEFLGRVRLVTSVASLAGVAVYNGLLKDMHLKKIFFWTTILGMGLGSTQLLLVTGVNRSLGISDEWFALGDSLILTVLGQVSFMPILVLAAKLCPPGVEATLFASLMSISNGAGVFGGALGAALTQLLGVTSESFSNLALLLVLCNLSSLLPLPFLRLLPEEEFEVAIEKSDVLLNDMEAAKHE